MVALACACPFDTHSEVRIAVDALSGESAFTVYIPASGQKCLTENSQRVSYLAEVRLAATEGRSKLARDHASNWGRRRGDDPVRSAYSPFTRSTIRTFNVSARILSV